MSSINPATVETKRTSNGDLPLIGQTTSCGAKTRNGTPCKQPAMPNGRCRLHGGKSLAGTASPQFKTGRYSKYMPQRLLERYEQSVDDPELLNMRHELSLLDARLTDLLQRVDTNEARALWEEIRKSHDEAKRMLINEDYAGLLIALDKLDRAAGSGLADYDAWNEIEKLIDQRRKLVEAEQKRLVAMQQMVSSEQVMVLIAALIDTVKRHVPDRHVLNAISTDINKIIVSSPS